MPSISSNGDDYVANVLTYIRNDFGNEGSLITAEDVAAVKKMNYAPKGMWTQAELDNMFAKEITDKPQWKVSTNFKLHPNFNLSRLTDNKFGRPFFSSKSKRQKGYAITIELPKVAVISEVAIDSSLLPKDYSRHYTIEFSVDGNHWHTVVENSTAAQVNIEQTLGHKAKYIRLTNLENPKRRPWRINEVSLFGSYL
jgi:hypothetical protein